jgi:hypothetical protein
MADSINPAASHHLPSFITPPGETDVLMVVTGILLLLGVLAFGLLFFRLHTLPERLAHKSQKIQFEIVAILGLIALFTHMHIFWIAGLFLALIDIPDFGTALGRMARSLEKMAGIKTAEPTDELRPETVPAMTRSDNAQAHDWASKDDPMGTTKRPESVLASQKEASHA